MAKRSWNVSELSSLNEAWWQAVNQSAHALKAGADKIVETKRRRELNFEKNLNRKNPTCSSLFRWFVPEALLLKHTSAHFQAMRHDFLVALAGPQGDALAASLLHSTVSAAHVCHSQVKTLIENFVSLATCNSHRQWIFFLIFFFPRAFELLIEMHPV